MGNPRDAAVLCCCGIWRLVEVDVRVVSVSYDDVIFRQVHYYRRFVDLPWPRAREMPKSSPELSDKDL
jgi:hypothetical protein